MAWTELIYHLAFGAGGLQIWETVGGGVALTEVRKDV